MFTTNHLKNVGREQNSTLARWQVTRDSAQPVEVVAEKLTAYEDAHGPAATEEALKDVLYL